MVKKKRRILWDDKAKEKLKEEIAEIRKKSPQGALSVKNKIFENIGGLSDNPEMYEADDLKKDNDGSYRRFFAYSYRVAYRITDEAILILRVRHTSEEPLEY